jgi:hypothetical protein
MILIKETTGDGTMNDPGCGAVNSPKCGAINSPAGGGIYGQPIEAGQCKGMSN